MTWGRSKSRTRAAEAVAPPTVPVPPAPRQDGPLDLSEVSDAVVRVDFGALKIRPRDGMEIQVAGDGTTHLAVLLIQDGSAVELRPLAGSKSGGDWARVRAQLVEEITARGSQVVERDGPFGPELLTQFPAEGPDGTDLVQPARFLAVEGPRWLLQAAILGPAGMETNDTGGLMDVLRDVVVERGPEPRLLGELLPLTVPTSSDSADHDV